MAAKIPSLHAQRALTTLGSHIRIARLKRRISVRSFAERLAVSERTIIRLEKGDAGVSMGTLAMACLALGELDRLADLLDPGTDDIGLMLDRDTLPKRIVRKRAQDKSSIAEPGVGDHDDEGVGF